MKKYWIQYIYFSGDIQNNRWRANLCSWNPQISSLTQVQRNALRYGYYRDNCYCNVSVIWQTKNHIVIKTYFNFNHLYQRPKWPILIKIFLLRAFHISLFCESSKQISTRFLTKRLWVDGFKVCLKGGPVLPEPLSFKKNCQI